jgi:hypothetical protein
LENLQLGAAIFDGFRRGDRFKRGHFRAFTLSLLVIFKSVFSVGYMDIQGLLQLQAKLIYQLF